MEYRPDIDGLRAVAVIFVVAFHTFPQYFPGGFIGVDIFFVISGFLISNIIFNILEKDNFRFGDFYKRRVRRIFPALTIVLLSCLALGSLVLLPDEFKQLAKHTATGGAFSANIQLWRESGYFDLSSEHKPLLHLWSLGIEEQFYFFWPACLVLLWKRKRSVLPAVTTLTAVSFGANVLCAGRYPTTTFFLPFTRLWELALGCLLAYANMFHGGLTVAFSNRWSAPRIRRGIANGSSLAGAFLIAAAMLLLDRSRTFPGWWALLPTIGSVLMISAGPEAWVNGKVLRHRGMVGIGMISYPLYLWHWPLLSFARIVTKPTATVKFALVGLSLVLAWATWRFVELKLRDRGRRKGVSADIPAFSIGLAFTCLLGAVFFESNALARRVTTDFGELAVDLAEPNTLSKYVDGPPEVQGLHFNLQSKPGHPDAVVVGDSHARTLLDGLAAVDRRRTWLAMGGYGCPPAVNIPVVHSALPRPCEMITKRVYEYLAEPSSPGLVVLAFYGYYSEATDLAPVDVNDYMRPSLLRIGESTAQAAKEEALFAGLDRSVQLLVEHHKRVLLVIDGPELPFLPRDCIKRPYLTNYATCSIETSAVEQRQQGLRRIVRRLQERAPSLEIFDTVPLLCDRLQCAPVVAGFSYYRDNNHLSLRGSEKIAAAVLNAIDHAGPTARSAGLMNSVR